MYAYIDGTRPVHVGVYFCHVLLEDGSKLLLGQRLLDSLSVLPEHRLNGCGVDGGPVRLRLCDDVLQLGLAHLQPVDFVLKLRNVHAAQHGLHVCQLLALRLQALTGPIDGVGNFFGGLCVVLRAQEGPDVLDHEGLQLLGVDVLRRAGVGAVLVAADVIGRLVALLIGAGVAHIGRSTALALDEAGQQIGPAGGLVGRSPFIVAHTLLHLPPCSFINDGWNHALDADTVGVGASPGPLAQQLHPALVPGVDTYIALVGQDAAEAVAADRATPLPRRAIQRRQNLLVAVAVGVHVIDGLHQPGLFGVDDVVLVHDVVAERGQAAQEHPLFGAHRHTVEALLAGVEDFHLTHAHGEQLHEEVLAVGEVSQVLAGGADDLDAKQGHFLAEGKPVGHVTGASADVIDHHCIELPALGCGYQLLEPGPVGIGAALALVGVGGHDGDTILGAVLENLGQLVLNAVFCLLICGVAGVCCAFFHRNTFHSL